MTAVANAISALLYTHDTVIVPGLGAFLCRMEGAKVNVITNQFEKPSATLGFDPLQREENDLVVNYLVMNDGITVEDARQQVMEFVSDIFAKLKVGETAEIPEVGTLSYGENQELVFNAVASNDYNGDAFGLDDITPQPVYGTGYGKRETEQEKQQTEPQKQETEPLMTDDDHRRHYWWIWVLVLILAAAGVALWYFKFSQVPPKTQPQQEVPTNDTVVPDNDTVVMDNDTVVIPNDSTRITNDSTRIINDSVRNASDTLVIANDSVKSTNDSVKNTNDSVAVTPDNPPIPNDRPVEVVKPDATSKAFIVGGCFAIEKNALKMTIEAREQGCAEAFVMKRGSKFFVCYGQYPSSADAKAALPEVMSKYNSKVWILTK